MNNAARREHRRDYWLVIDTDGCDDREFIKLSDVALSTAIAKAQDLECPQVRVRVYTSLCGHGRRY
jgi:hypothetical protein